MKHFELTVIGMIIIVVITLISGAISAYVLHKTPAETMAIMEEVAQESATILAE